MPIAYYISHPQVQIDPHKPVPRWSLSQIGVSRLEIVRERDWVKSIAAFISSDETKAMETAELLNHDTSRPLIVREDAHENDRSATGFVPPDRFEELANQFFAEPDKSVLGWETAQDAQSRIVAMADEMLKEHGKKGNLAFTGHGGVGTLLLCALQGAPIARIHDQPAGGGNVFAFDSVTRTVLHGWKALEEV